MKRTRSGGKKKHARTRTNVVIYEGGREKMRRVPQYVFRLLRIARSWIKRKLKRKRKKYVVHYDVNYFIIDKVYRIIAFLDILSMYTHIFIHD